MEKYGRMRDRLIHDYMGINYSIVWDVVRNKIPELSDQIAEVIRDEQKALTIYYKLLNICV